MHARGLGPVGRSATPTAPRLVPDAGDLVPLRSVPDGLPALAGFSVAVASDVRRPDVADHLDAAGAKTTGVTAFRTVPQPEPDVLAPAVAASADGPLDYVVVSSAFGLRAWFDAARRAGRGDELHQALASARLLARDARAADGLRELGFSQIWSTEAGTVEELFRYLFAQSLTGLRVAAQIERDTERELCHALRAQGATVIEIPTTHTTRPPHVDVLRRLCDLVVRHQVDAVALLGPSATRELLAQASRDDVLDDVLNAFVERVAAVCLGSLTAGPLKARGVPVMQPPLPLAESLAALAIEELPRRSDIVDVGDQRLEIRGHAVVLGGRLIPVQAGPLAVLRALAGRPGRVMSSAEILAAMPGPSTVDVHAIEMAVSRLRGALGRDAEGRELVQTVMRRGYRLAV